MNTNGGKINKNLLCPIPNLLPDKRDKQKAYLLTLSTKFSEQFEARLDEWSLEDGMMVAETITLLDYVYILFGRIEQKFYDDIPEHYRFDVEFAMIEDIMMHFVGEVTSYGSQKEPGELSLTMVSVVQDALNDIIHRYHNIAIKKPPFWHKWIS